MVAQKIASEIAKKGTQSLVQGILSLAKAKPKHPFYKEISTIWNKPAVQKDYFNEVIYSPSLNKKGTRNELLESVSTVDKQGKSKSLFDLGHLQQSQFRKEGSSTKGDYKFIQNLNDEVNSYVKNGTGRTLDTLSSQKQDNKVFIHSDFKTPDKLVSKMDFAIHGDKIKFLGQDTPFTTQSEGFITNQIRNRSYHRHYENRLARWLTEKKLIEKAFQDKKISKGRMLTDMEASNYHIVNIERDMRKLGLTSAIWDNAKKTFKYYGKPYDKQVEELLNDMQKSYMLRNPPDRLQEGFNNRLIEYFTKKIGHNKGGSVDYGEMKQVVPLLDPGESQHLAKGGKGGPIPNPGMAVQYVKNQIMPSVLKNVSQIASKILPKDTTNPFVVVDKNNLPIKDFKTQNEADKWLNTKGETVPEDEFYESIINYSVKSKDQIQSETVSTIQETPAMVYKTPDVIKNSPMEIAQGKQWLGILKKSGVSPKELDDTSIGPYLSIQAPNKKITKAELMETFDLVSPNFEVIALGKRDAGKMSKNIIDKFNQVKSNVQMSGTDQGVVNNFGAILQNTITATTDKQLSSVSKQLNSLLKRAYGIDSALSSSDLATNTQIAAPIRSIVGDLTELLKTRGASLTYESTPKHSGDQVLPGGNNYRELAFKWTPGSLRKSESGYIPSHSFGLKDERAQGIFVHSRLSDRTDNYGRKILFVEEIQSDMHQRAQKTLREGGTNVYKTREDKMIGVQPAIDEMTALQGKIDRILAVDPTNQALPSLYQKRESLAAKIQEIRDTMGSSGGGGTPEGPFQRSGDYGSFVMKYLLRLAKENNYDGVALSTGNIKNRRGYGSEESQKGHYGFYDKIMQKELKKLAKKYGIDYVNTVINDGKINWGNVPLLLLKNTDKVMEGFQAFKTGGLARENFVDVVPLL